MEHVRKNKRDFTTQHISNILQTTMINVYCSLVINETIQTQKFAIGIHNNPNLLNFQQYYVFGLLQALLFLDIDKLCFYPIIMMILLTCRLFFLQTVNFPYKKICWETYVYSKFGKLWLKGPDLSTHKNPNFQFQRKIYKSHQRNIPNDYNRTDVHQQIQAVTIQAWWSHNWISNTVLYRWFHLKPIATGIRE